MHALLAPIALTLCAVSAGAIPPTPDIYFQAHRGGKDEVPENTLPALKHAWSIPGAVPEVDIRTTADGVPIIMHDDTPRRTTNAPAEWADRKVSDIPFDTLRQWDAGSWFGAGYAGTRVPSLDEVLTMLKEKPGRQIYLDLKGIDTAKLIALLKKEEVTDRVIFVHGSPAECEKLSHSWPGARTMTWLSGDPDRIKAHFRALAADGFPGISQIQLHLRPKEGAPPGIYELDPAFLQEAMDSAQKAGGALQVRPFVFDPPALRALTDLGVRWFVADAPKALRAALDQALAE